jgi:Holliday junction resolvase RusA-like endonuclease
MSTTKEKPACGARAVPVSDLAGASINSESSSHAHELQRVIISQAGQPIGKQRARAYLRRGRISHYTPTESRAYEEQVRLSAWREMRALGLKPLDRPIEVELCFVFAPPASWPEKKKLAAIAGDIPHLSKPDCDNLTRAGWMP